MELERQRYEGALSEEVEAALRARISQRPDGIVVWREVPIPSRAVMHLFREEIARYSAGEPFDLLIDLRDAGRPDADARDGIREVFEAVPNVRCVAAYTERNALLNSAARFVLRRCCPEKFTVHKKLEDALDAISSARARSVASR